MYSLLSAIWLCLPAAPLNPIEQDTLPDFSVHFSVGAIGPNGVLTAGPEFSVHYEMLVVHPVLIRGGIDYSYGEVTSLRYPAGNLHTGLAALEVLYYRGTNGLIGYIGGGVVYAKQFFSPWQAASDSLWAREAVADIKLTDQVGYRATLGLRYRQLYSLEIGVTELYPDFIKESLATSNQTISKYKQIKTGGFRVTLGYIIPL